MRVIKASEGTSEERTGQAIFEGQVWARGLAEGEGHLTASVVQFAVGARTRMHTHTSDQLLYVVSGIGKVGTNEGEQVIATGDVALIPAGEPHWHGAGDSGSPMSHLTVMRGDTETEVLG
ncbi:MAG: cupin domain-containing protein [Dehalococcoidia bacterium]